MKKLLAMLCLVAVLVGCLVVSASAASTKTGYCQKCKQTVTWEALTAYGTLTADTHKHYYIPADTTAAKQLILKAGNVCIDLNGKDMVFQGGRAFLVYGSTAENPATLSIQDSVGGATVTSWSFQYLNEDGTKKSSSNNNSGGVMWVDDYCTLNVYGGTYAVDQKTPETSFMGTGGIVSIFNSAGTSGTGGTFNLYGGTLKGTTVTSRGGTVDIRAKGVMNVYGGVIERGSAPKNGGNGVNVREKSCIVRLYNDARVDDLFFQYNNYNLVVDSSYTGETYVAFNTSNVTSGLTAGGKIGTLSGDTAFTGELYCYNGSGFKTVVSGTNVNLAALDSGDRLKDCVHCNRLKKWDAFSTTAPTAAGEYHYYFTKNYDISTAKQFTVKENITVCLDMNGKSYNTRGRALGTSGAKAYLNVMDLVGGGIITATGGNNNPGGGCVSVGSGSGGFNLYSGTLTYVADAASSTSWGGTGRGGVIQSNAPVNIYGGKIIGGDVVDTTYEFTGAEGIGGAICAGSTLNIYGGEITSGTCPDSGAGPCIYIFTQNVKVLVANDAKVDDIYFPSLKNDQLTVSGAFTGKLNVSYAPSVALSERQPIGIAANDCDLKKAAITCGDYFIHAEDGKLILSTYSAGIPAATGGVGYNSLQAAIDACTDGKVELLNDTPEVITVSKDITLQLNGCSVGGATIADGATLYLMDSATEDFTVDDGVYGKLSNVTGNVVGAANGGDSYLIINENGVVSAHCVRLNIHTMTLRVENAEDKQEPGLYYKADFKADEKAAPQIATFGVALSVRQEPTAENLESGWIKYSVHDHFEAGALGNLGNNASTLLTGILKNVNTDKTNIRNLNMPIYGRAYCKTTDGQVLVGNLVERSLLQQLQAIDGIVPSLAEIQATGVVKLYNRFSGILENCQLPGIKEAVETHEEGTLKVLVLGNSHGLDATNLLYEVFHTEAPDQKVIIAALYYSGCNMDQHKSYLSGNQKVYTYHKNDGTQPNRAWVVKDATCLDALEDEQWDVIVMQQMNHRAGMDYEYDSSWKYVAEYLLNNQDHTPKLAFHMTWTNPDNYELYLNDNAPLKNPQPASWRNTHEQYWTNSATGKYDQSLQYLDIARCIKTYLVDDTSVVGRPYDYIIPAGTAVEYAQDVLGRSQEEIYRDYTHMNDYGRLITAYTWYATIMGIDEIDEMNLDAVPANLKHKNSKFPAADANGNYTVTADMKEDLIASVNWALKNPLSLPASE